MDHINGNTLDNRKENLRICTIVENVRNSNLSKNNKSGYKGVHFHKQYKKFEAYIWKDRKKIGLGYFDNKEDAARAYNKAALTYHGEFAKLNDIKE